MSDIRQIGVTEFLEKCHDMRDTITIESLYKKFNVVSNDVQVLKNRFNEEPMLGESEYLPSPKMQYSITTAFAGPFLTESDYTTQFNRLSVTYNSHGYHLYACLNNTDTLATLYEHIKTRIHMDNFQIRSVHPDIDKELSKWLAGNALGMTLKECHLNKVGVLSVILPEAEKVSKSAKPIGKRRHRAVIKTARSGGQDDLISSISTIRCLPTELKYHIKSDTTISHPFTIVGHQESTLKSCEGKGDL